MTLNDFLTEMTDDLKAFEEFWQKNHSENPDDFPMDIRNNNSGIWLEQFLAFIETR